MDDLERTRGSIIGLAIGDERHDTVRSIVVPLAEAGELPADGEADVRYAGQSFELTVPADGFGAEDDARCALAADFRPPTPVERAAERL